MRKLIATILTAIMLASPLAVAADLGDYPGMLSDAGVLDVYVVVGADADPSDVVGAVDLAARLAAESYDSVSTGGGVTVSGGKSEDILLNTALNASTAFGATLDDDDVPGLLDTKITINNVISSSSYKDTYDVHDELRLTSGAAVETGLTSSSPHEDFKSETFLEIGKSSVSYYLVFDDTINNGNYIANASDDYPVEVQFLGRALTITSASDADTMTIQSGTEYALNVGESVTVDGVTVTLVNVGSSDSIVVEVDGVSGTVSSGGQKTINGVNVKNKEAFYSTEKEDRTAVILVGEDVSDTVNDDDAYCVGAADKNACEDDALWVWDLAGLTGGSPTVGILYNGRLDEYDEVIGVGEEFALPHDYMKLSLDSYVESDYRKYVVEADEIVDLYPASGSTSEVDTARTIHIYGEGSGKDSIETAGTAHDTDDVYLYYWGDTTALVGVYQKDSSDNKVRYVQNVSNATSTTLAYLTYQDTRLEVKVQATDGVGNLTFVTDDGDDINMYIEADTSDRFTYLGQTDGDTTYSNDLLYGNRDISGWEEDTRAQDGIVIYDPKAHLSGDSFEFDVNGDETDFKVNVVVLGPSGSASSGASGSVKKVVPVSSAVAKLDTEVSDPATVGRDLVLVGGPAVNRLTAQAMGLDYPTYGGSGLLPFAEGEGYVEYMDGVFATGQDVVVVAGWSADNTRDASSVLQQVDSFLADLDGNMAVKVTAVSSAGITAV
jgi:hypothetical protein